MNVWLTSRLFRSKSRSEPKENIPSKTTPHNSCCLLCADRARVTLQQSNENETMLLQCVDSEGQSSRAVQMLGKVHGAQSHQRTSQQNTKPEMQGNRWNIREKFQLWNQQQENKPHSLVPHTVLLQQELRGNTSGEIPLVSLSNRKTTTHFNEGGIFMRSAENCQLTITLIPLLN